MRREEGDDIVVVEREAGRAEALRVRRQVEAPSDDPGLQVDGPVAAIAQLREPSIEIGEEEYRDRRRPAQFLFEAEEGGIAPEVTEPVKSAEEPVVVQLKQAPVMAVKPTGEEVQVAEVVTPPPAKTEIAEQTPPKTLPKTASPLPLIGLFGLVALGGAFTLRFVRRCVR